MSIWNDSIWIRAKKYESDFWVLILNLLYLKRPIKEGNEEYGLNDNDKIDDKDLDNDKVTKKYIRNFIRSDVSGAGLGATVGSAALGMDTVIFAIAFGAIASGLEATFADLGEDNDGGGEEKD